MSLELLPTTVSTCQISSSRTFLDELAIHTTFMKKTRFHNCSIEAVRLCEQVSPVTILARQAVDSVLEMDIY